MKETAQSCSIVAVLIAAVMFAAPFTPAGGTNGNSGKPIFQSDLLYQLFMIANAGSFFLSITAVLVFVGILTSQYIIESFMKSLPKRLIIGLVALFCSMVTMMLTFCINYGIAMCAKIAWVVPVWLMVGVPVVSFVLLQFPLLLEIASSTYGPGIFLRKPKSMFVLKG